MLIKRAIVNFVVILCVFPSSRSSAKPIDRNAAKIWQIVYSILSNPIPNRYLNAEQTQQVLQAMQSDNHAGKEAAIFASAFIDKLIDYKRYINDTYMKEKRIQEMIMISNFIHTTRSVKNNERIVLAEQKFVDLQNVFSKLIFIGWMSISFLDRSNQFFVKQLANEKDEDLRLVYLTHLALYSGERDLPNVLKLAKQEQQIIFLPEDWLYIIELLIPAIKESNLEVDSHAITKFIEKKCTN